MADVLEFEEIHDEDGALRADFVRAVADALEQEEPRELRRLVRDLHEADVADLIEFLPSDDRIQFILKLGRTFDVEALPELDEAVRDELMEALPNQFISSAVRKLDTDDALNVIVGTWGNNQYISRTPVVSENVFMTSCYSIPGYYLILEGSCIGCTVCARRCPVNAISGERRGLHVIDQQTCIKCGECLDACKFDAVVAR